MHRYDACDTHAVNSGRREPDAQQHDRKLERTLLLSPASILAPSVFQALLSLPHMARPFSCRVHSSTRSRVCSRTSCLAGSTPYACSRSSSCRYFQTCARAVDARRILPLRCDMMFRAKSSAFGVAWIAACHSAGISTVYSLSHCKFNCEIYHDSRLRCSRTAAQQYSRYRSLFCVRTLAGVMSPVRYAPPTASHQDARCRLSWPVVLLAHACATPWTMSLPSRCYVLSEPSCLCRRHVSASAP